ncbi:MAG: CBS domain-containing protein [Halanaerobiaceae bacterium]|nr:CBS domain-containing protein [Halanaerobiaceae bacterium]
MKNSQIFLNSFSEIEEYLQRYTNTIHHDSFTNLVKKASRTNSIIREFKTDLFELKDLRNAIVHERTDGHVIAEPHDSTVELIQKIERLLKKPPGVLPTFKHKVVVLYNHDTVGEAVSIMKKKSYTQIPILDEEGRYLDLLTTNTIVRWLGSSVNHNSRLLETCIDEVLKYKESNNVCLFISADYTFFDVLEIFDEYRNTPKKLEAIIITEKGTPDEDFLGIITGWDLPLIYNKLDNF